ncbi:amidohydrolase [bacterium]|nr:MAG: amidohydrolase [bacterium]
MTIEWQEVQQLSKNLESYLIETRRFLHRNPELSWQEDRTSAYLKAQLASKGIEVKKELSDTGFYIELGPDTKEVLAWRADIDALAIQDQKTVGYKSAFDGIAHLCGHDAHSTIALGIACVLSQVELKKKVRIFWQPAEEVSPSGAPKMIEAGVLEGVTKLFALHVDPTLDSGKMAINAGYETASYDAAYVNLKAPSTAHSARPHLGKDLIWIASGLIQEWYGLAGRITDARDAAVLTFCKMEAGTAINVIPDVLHFSGTLRCVSNQAREALKKHLMLSAAYTGNLHGIEVQLEFGSSCPAIKNDETLAQAATQLLSSRAKIVKTRQSMGAEDFAWYTESVPSLFLRLGTRNGDATAWPLHHSLFDIDEAAIQTAVQNASYLLANS